MDLRRTVRGLRRRLAASRPEEYTLTPWTAPAREPLVAAQPVRRDGGLDALALEVAACRKCPLGDQRLNPVFGQGAPNAEVLFIGEGPGFDEDHQGQPFVGKSGQLLDKILAAIDLSRDTNAYIANIVKCHPMQDPSDPEKRGNDRAPSPEETAACRAWLDAQIALIKPKVLVTLGATALKSLFANPALGITKMRGRWMEYRPQDGGAPIKTLPTFHPAALLRDPALKRPVWEDMKSLRAELDGARN